jgi:putative ABC transport system permease protein
MAATLLANNLRFEDVKNIEKLRGLVREATALSMNTGEVAYKEITKNPSIVGVNEAYSRITNTKPVKGRFFSAIEEEKKDQVAVLGFTIAEDLFGSVDPVGKKIQVKNRPYTVIGVAEEKGGGFGGPSFDNYVYIPITSWFQLFDSSLVIRIIAQAQNETVVDETIGQIETYFLKRLEEDDFSVFKQEEILKVIDQVLGALTAGLGGIAAISLVVGGIGIMNIMLVSVTERTREIGLRKAVGATPNIILTQFLIESVVLSVTGGLIGVLIAEGLARIISQFVPAAVTWDAVLLAFGVSAAVGIVFGVYPARKASQLSPIEALRYE